MESVMVHKKTSAAEQKKKSPKIQYQTKQKLEKGCTDFIFPADVFAEVPPFPGSVSAVLIVITIPYSSLVREW